MVFKVGNRIPDNSILRRGTLIVGVPRQERDPMQPAIDQIERALRAKDAAVMAEVEQERRSSASTTRKLNETT